MMIGIRLPLLCGWLACLVIWGGTGIFRGEAGPESPTEAVNRLIVAIRNKQEAATQGEGVQGAPPPGLHEALKTVDLPGVSQRTLGKHWQERSLAEQNEFITLLAQLLSQVAFPKSAAFFRGIDMTVIDERIDGQQAVVATTVRHTQEGLIEIEYWLAQRDETWRIHDIRLDGVSLTRNLRSQFQRVITQHSYLELLRRMREKLERADLEATP